MTITLHLKPDVEAGLTARAQSLGVPLETYIRSAIERLALDRESSTGSSAEFRAMLDTLAGGSADLPLLPSAAFGRVSIYQDHD
jgi:hypothetical protein